MIINPYRYGAGGDPHWANVVSLLHFDDPGDPWKDEKGVIWTANGSPVLDTTNKKFGASSLGLNGSSHLSASDAGFAFGTGDFTLECQLLNGGNANKGVMSTVLSGAHTGAVGLAIESGTRYFVQNNNTSTQSAATTIPASFQHVAVVRASGQIRLYQNGNLLGTFIADTRNLTATNFYLGGYFSTSFRMLGNIDEVRITAGVARYTANFTPPTAAFPNS